MAGQPGKSGGARKGAGRKKKPENEGAEFVGATEGMTPIEVLEFFMHEPSIPAALRIKAAQAAAPFRHHKLGEGGKKEQKQKDAEQAAGGRFGAPQPPRLVTNNGK